MLKSKLLLFILAVVILTLLISALALIGYYENHSNDISLISSHNELKQIKSFASEEEFINYLAKANELTSFSYYHGWSPMQTANPTDINNAAIAVETSLPEKSLNEPDIVQTDNKNIYYSQQSKNTKIIQAWPTANLSIASSIDEAGEMLLVNSTLIIFNKNKISGLSTKDPASLQKIWSYDIDEKTSYDTARLYQGKIYLITKTNLDQYHPCPLQPLNQNGAAIEIACTDIYYPKTTVPIDATYNIMILDPATGKIEKSMAFVGSYNNSVVYFSPNNLYITFTYFGDMVEQMYAFLNADGQGLFPPLVVEKIKQLKDYKLSAETKVNEYNLVLENYLNTLSASEREAIQDNLKNQLTAYLKRYNRDMVKTAIAKIDLQHLNISATGEISGLPLDQYAINEYQNNLRIAVTMDESPIFSANGTNDLYILNENLQTLSSVLDINNHEKISTAKFIGDHGYLTTLSETNPFSILDLSNSLEPRFVENTKQIANTANLHSLSENLILTANKENDKVKLILLDIGQLEIPQEISNYALDEYYIDILNNNQTFVQDEQHKIFFIAGLDKGYIFSYQNNQLSLLTTIAASEIKKAIIINNYLYIIGANKTIILDENTWQEIKNLTY